MQIVVYSHKNNTAYMTKQRPTTELTLKKWQCNTLREEHHQRHVKLYTTVTQDTLKKKHTYLVNTNGDALLDNKLASRSL